MHWPQLTIAIGLPTITILVLRNWWQTRKRYASYLRFLSGRQRFVVQHGWLVVGIPLGEAITLWCGGFWG